MSFRHRLAALRELIQRYRTHFSWFWKQRDTLEPPKLKSGEADFLPAALALQLAPISPTARWTARLLILLITFLLLWSIFGQIDIIVSASGKIIPSTYTKTIASVETARVEHIFVEDGQIVHSGQLLLVLDTHIIDHEQSKAEIDRDMAMLQVARSRALLASIVANKLIGLKNIEGITPDKISDARNHLDSQWINVTSQLNNLNGEITRYSMQLPIVSRREQNYRSLAKNHDVSVIAWLEKEQDLIELQGKLANARHQRDVFIAETRKKTEEELNDGIRQEAEAQQDVLRANSHKALLKLVAPVDGIVQQLAVHTVGGVVAAAQPLMIIVPKENQVEIEAVVENKDIGFVHKGQKVAVKIDAFDYSKYGMLHGLITYVSRDAMISGINADTIQNDQSESGNPAKKTPISQYSIHIRLDQKAISINGESQALKPGMSTSIEIKTGRRRVIEYFLSPLIQNIHESINER